MCARSILALATAGSVSLPPRRSTAFCLFFSACSSAAFTASSFRYFLICASGGRRPSQSSPSNLRVKRVALSIVVSRRSSSAFTASSWPWTDRAASPNFALAFSDILDAFRCPSITDDMSVSTCSTSFAMAAFRCWCASRAASSGWSFCFSDAISAFAASTPASASRVSLSTSSISSSIPAVSSSWTSSSALAVASRAAFFASRTFRSAVVFARAARSRFRAKSRSAFSARSHAARAARRSWSAFLETASASLAARFAAGISFDASTPSATFFTRPPCFT
mmetsp:Transcript_10543/g.32465  ORF Transcript_10543/g.32465 Transcript_10543/m.32465 type:complete len:280 (+) Transcript_10543:639-1478(+)